MTPTELAHLAQFQSEVTRVGERIGEFLHKCIDCGISIDNPIGAASLPLTAYELGFLLEVVNQWLQDQRMRPLQAELDKYLKGA